MAAPHSHPTDLSDGPSGPNAGGDRYVGVVHDHWNINVIHGCVVPGPMPPRTRTPAGHGAPWHEHTHRHPVRIPRRGGVGT